MNANIKISGDKKLITCVLYQGGGIEVLKALHKRGINTSALWHARGSAIGDPIGKNGLPTTFEKEIITVVAAENEANEIFNFIFDTAKIDRPYGGFLYMGSLGHVSEYVLANISEEEET